MFAEGTLPVNRIPVDRISVARQTTSLPSSSTPSNAEHPQEAEGRAFVSEPHTGPTAGVVVTKSHIVETAPATAKTEEGPATRAEAGPSEESLREALAEKREEEKERLTRIADELSGKLNEHLRLRFSTDEDTGQDLFQLIEQKSGEVVQQIPSEEVLEFMKKFRDFSGLLFSEQA